MTGDVFKECEDRMSKSVDAFRRELASVRAGRANPSLLDRILVDYYGTATPINQLATVTVPEPRMLVVQPWDKGVIGDIERAVARSDLGVSPANDGNVIRVSLPQLTEERRQGLVRQVRRKAEEERVAIRNIRREANDLLREAEKEGGIPEDEARRGQESVQKLTDRFIAEVDLLLQTKENEITEV